MVIGGCLAMVYTVGIGSPVTTEFFRELGANEFHFGLIGGVPLVMLLLQFVGAAALNRAQRRKPVFIACLCVCRLLYLAVALLPLAFRRAGHPLVMPLIIALLAVSAATHNFAIPFFFSWMADLIPRRVMNRVWGWRQKAMHMTWTFTFLLVTLLLYRTDLPATVVFPVLTGLAVAAGLSDVLLFIGVTEPPNLIDRDSRPWRDFQAPLRHPAYRRFVVFWCCWSSATTVGAAFMQLYVLKVLGFAPWKTTLIWCVQGLGTAAASGMWGRLADRFGHRPVLKTCVTLKPLIALVFMLLTPANVAWLLPLAFFPDGMLNAGNALAANGYMLSYAPRHNRSMFIAAMTGLAGAGAGIAAILAGLLLNAMDGRTFTLLGRAWNPYQIIFGISLALRLACQPLLRRIREPGAGHSRALLTALMDEWPLWIVRFPVGLYRRMRLD